MNASTEELSHRLERVISGAFEMKWNINCKGVYKNREDATKAYKAGGWPKDPPYLKWVSPGDYKDKTTGIFYEGDNLGVSWSLITVKSTYSWHLLATAMCKCIKDCVPGGSTLHGSFNRMVESAMKGGVTTKNLGSSKSKGGGIDATGSIPLDGVDWKCCGECHYFRNRYADRMADADYWWENETTWLVPGEWTNRALNSLHPPYIPPRTGTLVSTPGYYARETLMEELLGFLLMNAPPLVGGFTETPGTDVTSWLQNIDCDKCTESMPGDVITTT
tara:strand:- start:843 stop:1670 length:828 start_codon:yes stop_codon:yes gene_type:complete